MSSLFDALEKLKGRGDANATSGGNAASGYNREAAAAQALNITPEPLSRRKWRRRMLVLLFFVVAPVTIAYVVHVYDETMRIAGEAPLMGRVVQFISGEQGAVRQGVGSAREAASGVAGTLDKLVGKYGNLPTENTQSATPIAPSISPEAVASVPPPAPGPVVSEVGAGIPEVAVPASIAPDGAKPPPLPAAPQAEMSRLIEDLVQGTASNAAMPSENDEFVPPMAGEKLPPADSPVSAHAELNRTQPFAMTGEDASMSVEFQQSMKLRGLYESAQGALDAGDNAHAISLFSEILAQNSEDETARFALAVSLQRAGRSQEAMSAYGELLKQQPQNLDAQTNYLAVLGQESPDVAIGKLEGMVRANPSFAPAWAQLSDLYAAKDLLGEAIAARKKALSLRPSHVPDMYNLAVLLDRAGNREEAFSAYRAVLKDASRSDTPLPVEDIRRRLEYLVR